MSGEVSAGGKGEGKGGGKGGGSNKQDAQKKDGAKASHKERVNTCSFRSEMRP